MSETRGVRKLRSTILPPQRASLESNDMDIRFPRLEMNIVPGEPLLFVVEVDGRRLDVRIEWSAIAALSGVGVGDAGDVRGFVKRNRDAIERAIKAHILARGVSPGRMIVLDRDELGGL
jgi:hypothetical protein